MTIAHGPDEVGGSGFGLELRRQTLLPEINEANQRTGDFDAARDRLREKGPAHPGTRPHTDGPDTHARGSGRKLIQQVQQIGHPLHAGLLAAQLLSHTDQAEQLAAVRLADLAPDATALALPRRPYRPTSTRHWHPVPTWAQPLLIAARAWHYLNGHHHPSRHLFQHTNFHHHNQLTETAAASGITPAINILTGDPAWPTPATPPR